MDNHNEHCDAKEVRESREYLAGLRAHFERQRELEQQTQRRFTFVDHAQKREAA